MKKTLYSIIVWSTLALSACAGVARPPAQPGPAPSTPTTPTAPAFSERTLAAHVTDGRGPLAGCAVTLTLPFSGEFTATTLSDGYAAWLVKIPNPDPGGGLNTRAHIVCPNFEPLDDSFVIAPTGNQDITFGGTVAGGNQPLLRPGPVSSRPRLITVAESPQIRENFGSMRDRQGRLMFQIFIGRLWLDGDLASIDDWMARAKDAGLTYFSVGTYSGDYHSYPLRGFDFRGQMDKFASMLDYLQRYPAADGGAFRFSWHMTDGGSGAALEYVKAREWADAVRKFEPYLVPGPGWETVGGCSDWTTEINLTWLKSIDAAFKVAPSFTHNCPGRLALSSFPVEPTDPYHGDEVGSYSPPHGGELPRYVFFQFEHGRAVTTSCGRTVDDGSGRGLKYPPPDDCALSRFDDVVARAGAGICADDYGHGTLCGWRYAKSSRPLFPVAFEGCTMDLYAGGTDLDCDERLANAALRVYEFYGVTPMFGSGLPTAWRPKTPTTFSFTPSASAPRFTFTLAQR